jgi:enterochelin esterase-like enzyme
VKAFAGLAAALILLAGCGGEGGSGAPSPATSAVSVASFSVDSRNTGISYPVSVYVPQNALSAQTLPVIYALDAETRFEPLMDVLQQSGTNAILVGISNTGANRRQVDFLLPGALAYYQFIVEELAPLIESRYRADPARRILSGHSSGGLFVGYALFMEAPANRRFSAFISADGSFWQQPDGVAQAEQQMFAANSGHAVPLTVVMGGDAQGNLPYVTQMYSTLLARNYPGMRLSLHGYNLGHVQMDAPFFREAIGIILGPP